MLLPPNETTPNRTGGVSKTKTRTASHRIAPYDSKKKIRTEPWSGLGAFIIEYFATVRVRCGL